MHTITGLPRSGSTLLTNILNQHPEFYASSTSPMAPVVNNMVTVFSAQLETTGLLIRDPSTPERIAKCARSVVNEWYQGKGRVIFDKGRGWSHLGQIHKELYPKGKQIVLVRDPRDVFASVEKQDRKSPMLLGNGVTQVQNVYDRASTALMPEGFIGSSVTGIMDLLNRNSDAIFIRYEDFSEYPERTMKIIYEAIGEEYYQHDFENVENTSEEVDELYLNKFPHTGSGKVQRVQSEWKDYISQELADEIINRYPLFTKHFNYGN